MELSISGDVNNYEATQEIPSIFWNPEVHYCTLKSPPLASVLSHTIPTYLSKFCLNIINTPTSWSSGFPTNSLDAFFFSPIHATCPARRICNI
jgi:hypothetical protein